MKGVGSTGDRGYDLGSERLLVTTANDAQRCSQARTLLLEYLTAWGCHDVDAVALVFSELVTNAVDHAGGATLIRVEPAADNRHVRIEVYDGVPLEPRLRRSGPDGGFGLLIVDRLSDSWGTSSVSDGKVVWAVILGDGSATSPHGEGR